MMVDGAAAAALGELARARWQAATGRQRRDRRAAAGARGRSVARRDRRPTSATRPSASPARCRPSATRRRCRSVARSRCESIAAARRFIYIENQYLTSAAIGAALARRLAEPDGPEVVAVLPREEHGWLEQSSMGVMRARLLRHLRASDHHGRLRLFYPTIPALERGACMNVHAKVMIVDDRWRARRLRQPQQPIDGPRHRVRPGPGRRPGPAPRRRRSRRCATGCSPSTSTATRRRSRTRSPPAGSLIARRRVAARPGPLAGPAARARGRTARRKPPDATAKAAVDLAFLDGLACDPEQPGARPAAGDAGSRGPAPARPPIAGRLGPGDRGRCWRSSRSGG